MSKENLFTLENEGLFCREVGVFSPRLANIPPFSLNNRLSIATAFFPKATIIERPEEFLTNPVRRKGIILALDLIWRQLVLEISQKKIKEPLGLRVGFVPDERLCWQIEYYPNLSTGKGSRNLLTQEPYGFHTLEEIKLAVQETIARFWREKGIFPAFIIVDEVYEGGKNFLQRLSDRGFFPLRDIPKKIADVVPRLRGWRVAEEAGILIPEGIIVLTDDVFRRWLRNNRSFTPEDEKDILLLAYFLTHNWSKIIIRRALYLPSLEKSVGKAIGFIERDHPEQAILILEEIFKEALSLTDRMPEVLEKGMVCAFFQRFVDPLKIEENEGRIKIMPQQRLPAGASAVPLTEEGDEVQIAMGYGNDRGERPFRVICRVAPNGIVEIREEEGFLREKGQQARMLVTVGESERWREVPEERRLSPPLSLEEIAAIARMVRAIVKKGGLPFRLEVTLGQKPEGRLGLYVTESVPCEVSKNILDPFDQSGPCFVFEGDDCLANLDSWLERVEGSCFVVLPPAVAKERDFNVPRFLEIVKKYQDKVVVLIGADYTTGHIVNNVQEAGLNFLCVGGDCWLTAAENDKIIKVYKREGSLKTEVSLVTIPGLVIPIAEGWKYGQKEVGAKAYGLSVIAREGMTVPDTVIIPANVLPQIIEGLGLEKDFEALIKAGSFGEAKARAEIIRNGLTNIPQTLKESITSAIAAAFSSETRLVVRSSASLEDLPKTAAAGIFTSVGGEEGVSLQEIERALIEVYRSLFADKAIELWWQRKTEGSLLKMAVIVSSFVKVGEQDASFYLFTRTREEERLANLSLNFGGQATEIADSVDTQGERGINVIFDKNSGKIINIEDIPPNLKGQVETIVAQLIKEGIVVKTERICQGPADVEGAWIGNKFCFFQARPLNI